MNGQIIRRVTIASLFIMMASHASAEDCVLGQKLYQQGLAEGQKSQWNKAETSLIESVTQCNRFNNWYLLGQAQLEMSKLEDAANSFEDARRYASTGDERVIAIARYAQVQSLQGLINEPLTLLHEVRKQHSKTPQWITQLTKDLDNKRVAKPLTVAAVTGALTNKSIRLFNLASKPALNVSINFKFDSVSLVKKSKNSVDVLAEALLEDALKAKQVTIIGHTDERGAGGYNLDLSKKRADAIAMAMIQKYPELKGRIVVKGRGEKEPLYEGKSEWEHQMNRRIEIKVQ